MKKIYISHNTEFRKADTVMQLFNLGNHLKSQGQTQEDFAPIIIACIGQPSFPTNSFVKIFNIIYWCFLRKESLPNEILLTNEKNIADTKKATDYIKTLNFSDNFDEDLQGHPQARELMAKTLTEWYGTTVEPKNLLFTVGGSGALYIIFQVLNTKYPNGVILTPFPYYGLYRNSVNQNHLFPIEQMNSNGYRLTAQLFEESLLKAIEYAKSQNTVVSAFLMANPSNPLGQTVDEEELIKIAEILRNYPILIIIDEAYAELCFDTIKNISLLTVAPDLAERMIILRSATKGLSLAGERLAVTLIFDDALMQSLADQCYSSGIQLPCSLQHLYANTLNLLDEIELNVMHVFYGAQVKYVANRLKSMGAAMPDPNYRVDSTFYVLADLSDLLGLPLSEEASIALKKEGVVKTDDDIVYNLLYEDHVIVAPFSYFGMAPEGGYIRITCSRGFNELGELLNRIEKRLISARKIHQTRLINEINTFLAQINLIDSNYHAEILNKINEITNSNLDTTEKMICINLKRNNHEFDKILTQVKYFIVHHDEAKLSKYTIFLQSWWRSHKLIEEKKEIAALKEKWKEFVNERYRAPRIKAVLLTLAMDEWCEIADWNEWLQKENNSGKPKKLLSL